MNSDAITTSPSSCVIPTSFNYWNEDNEVGAPNVMLRSSMVSVVGKGRRRYFSRTRMNTWDNSLFFYTGPQIDVNDFEVWLAIVNRSKGEVGGGQCDLFGTHTSARELLAIIGKSYSGANAKWLAEVLIRLQSVVVEVPLNDSVVLSSQLLGSIQRNQFMKKLVIVMDQRITGFFVAGFARLNLEERRKLRNSGQLALWLHGFYSSHRATTKHFYSVETIWGLCGCDNSELRSFKQKLKKSLVAMEAATGWNCYIDSNDRIHVEK